MKVPVTAQATPPYLHREAFTGDFAEAAFQKKFGSQRQRENSLEAIAFRFRQHALNQCATHSTVLRSRSHTERANFGKLCVGELQAAATQPRALFNLRHQKSPHGFIEIRQRTRKHNLLSRIM